MLKIIVMLVFIYNLVTTVSNPTAKDMILNVGLLAIALSLVLSASKKVLAIVIKVIAVVAIIGYILLQVGVIPV